MELDWLRPITCRIKVFHFNQYLAQVMFGNEGVISYSRGPFLAAMFLLVFWILFWEPWWSRFVGIRGAPRLTKACPRHAWQELLWKKPPLRTSTCGRHRRQARMCVFPQRGAYSWWTWTTIPWKPWKFAEKHGQRIAYSWFNSIKRPY